MLHPSHRDLEILGKDRLCLVTGLIAVAGLGMATTAVPLGEGRCLIAGAVAYVVFGLLCVLRKRQYTKSCPYCGAPARAILETPVRLDLVCIEKHHTTMGPVIRSGVYPNGQVTPFRQWEGN